jgi:hypothetical protein
MWRWYTRIGFGLLAVLIVVAGFSALVGGDWWEPALAAEWWIEYMVVVGLALVLITGVRRLIRRG